LFGSPIATKTTNDSGISSTGFDFGATATTTEDKTTATKPAKALGAPNADKSLGSLFGDHLKNVKPLDSFGEKSKKVEFEKVEASLESGKRVKLVIRHGQLNIKPGKYEGKIWLELDGKRTKEEKDVRLPVSLKSDVVLHAFGDSGICIHRFEIFPNSPNVGKPSKKTLTTAAEKIESKKKSGSRGFIIGEAKSTSCSPRPALSLLKAMKDYEEELKREEDKKKKELKEKQNPISADNPKFMFTPTSSTAHNLTFSHDLQNLKITLNHRQGDTTGKKDGKQEDEEKHSSHPEASIVAIWTSCNQKWARFALMLSNGSLSSASAWLLQKETQSVLKCLDMAEFLQGSIDDASLSDCFRAAVKGREVLQATAAIEDSQSSEDHDADSPLPWGVEQDEWVRASLGCLIEMDGRNLLGETKGKDLKEETKEKKKDAPEDLFCVVGDAFGSDNTAPPVSGNFNFSDNSNFNSGFSHANDSHNRRIFLTSKSLPNWLNNISEWGTIKEKHQDDFVNPNCLLPHMLQNDEGNAPSLSVISMLNIALDASRIKEKGGKEEKSQSTLIKKLYTNYRDLSTLLTAIRCSHLTVTLLTMSAAKASSEISPSLSSRPTRHARSSRALQKMLGNDDEKRKEVDIYGDKFGSMVWKLARKLIYTPFKVSDAVSDFFSRNFLREACILSRGGWERPDQGRLSCFHVLSGILARIASPPTHTSELKKLPPAALLLSHSCVADMLPRRDSEEMDKKFVKHYESRSSFLKMTKLAPNEMLALWAFDLLEAVYLPCEDAIEAAEARNDHFFSKHRKDQTVTKLFGAALTSAWTKNVLDLTDPLCKKTFGRFQNSHRIRAITLRLARLAHTKVEFSKETLNSYVTAVTELSKHTALTSKATLETPFPLIEIIATRARPDRIREIGSEEETKFIPNWACRLGEAVLAAEQLITNEFPAELENTEAKPNETSKPDVKPSELKIESKTESAGSASMAPKFNAPESKASDSKNSESKGADSKGAEANEVKVASLETKASSEGKVSSEAKTVIESKSEARDTEAKSESTATDAKSESGSHRTFIVKKEKRKRLDVNTSTKETVDAKQSKATIVEERQRKARVLLHEAWPYLDHSLDRGESKMGDLLRDTRWLFRHEERLKMWNRDVRPPDIYHNQQYVTLDRKKAADALSEAKAKSQEGSSRDPRATHIVKQSLFCQLYEALKNCHINSYKLRKGERMLKVHFSDEAGIDAGGLYRELFTEISKELMRPELGFFTHSPNSKSNIGQFRDTLVPSPLPRDRSARLSHKEYLRFLGKLMGAALLSRTFLQLKLAPVVWKQMVFSKIHKEDVQNVDVLSFRMAEAMRSARREGFNLIYEGNFTGLTADRKLCPLAPNGTKINVTWETRMVYASLMFSFRKHEFAEQVTAIREGLCEVIPVCVLMLYQGHELEIEICGKKTVDIPLLKRHTNYEGGYEENHPVIVRFWKVLEHRFDDEMRQKFLQFVWGRSRLPNDDQDWTQNLRISKCYNNNGDGALPLSHTCFFQIELPMYSTEDIMYKNLKLAVESCSTFAMG